METDIEKLQRMQKELADIERQYSAASAGYADDDPKCKCGATLIRTTVFGATGWSCPEWWKDISHGMKFSYAAHKHKF